MNEKKHTPHTSLLKQDQAASVKSRRVYWWLFVSPCGTSWSFPSCRSTGVSRCRSPMPMSEYELQRMRNIEENKGKLIALGIEKNPLDLERATPKTVKGASVNRRAKPERPPVRQRSLRVQNLGADGEPLPDRDVKPPTPDPEDKRPMRKPPAPLDAAKVRAVPRMSAPSGPGRAKP
jgi:hypothetical protein